MAGGRRRAAAATLVAVACDAKHGRLREPAGVLGGLAAAGWQVRLVGGGRAGPEPGVLVQVSAVDLLEGVAAVAGAGTDGADLLHGAGALGLPVEHLALLENDVAVQADRAGSSLKE